jgi:hypothetical protein
MILEGRLHTPSQGERKLRYLDMIPMVDLRYCGWCGERQDALKCKQRADTDEIRWKCGYCNHLNSWKKVANKSCQVKDLNYITREVA